MICSPDADFDRKSECTFCKTPLPSLLFSRSAETPFPEEHHRQSSPANVIAAAQENAEKLPKGERWDRGLTLPGTLDLGSFAFTDDKLGVVFEDEAMVCIKAVIYVAAIRKQALDAGRVITAC